MEGIVGRAIVDEQYLGIVNALRYDALYASFHILFGIVGRYDD